MKNVIKARNIKISYFTGKRNYTMEKLVMNLCLLAGEIPRHCNNRNWIKQRSSPAHYDSSPNFR